MNGFWIPYLALLVLGAPGEGLSGYTLQTEWERIWHRVYDRHGRPDPDGPVQQRWAGEPYPEYPLDVADGFYPMVRERAWSQRDSGARMWIHSLDERTLTNNVQMKARAPMGENWSLGLAFDRMETKEEHSDLFELEFSLDAIGESPFFASLSFYSRWEKEDIDAVFSLGARSSAWGTGVLRVMSFDTFVNASHGLIRARDGVVDEHLEQLDPPLGLSAEYHSPERYDLRGELYAGWVLPADTEHHFPKQEISDHIRRREGLFLAALGEWAVPGLPLRLGATGSFVRTLMGWQYALNSRADQRVVETTMKAEFYALSRPRTGLDFELRVARIWRPEENRWAEQPLLDTEREDDTWFWSARSIWMLSQVAGVEMGVLGLSRTASGDPYAMVEGTNQRLLTRCVLQMGDVWVSFGVSWDLEPGWSPYDGGGMTMIVPF